MHELDMGSPVNTEELVAIHRESVQVTQLTEGGLPADTRAGWGRISLFRPKKALIGVTAGLQGLANGQVRTDIGAATRRMFPWNRRAGTVQSAGAR